MVRDSDEDNLIDVISENVHEQSEYQEYLRVNRN